SPRLDQWHRLSPLGPHTPRMASIRFLSLFTTRCSACSESVLLSGPRRICAYLMSSAADSLSRGFTSGGCAGRTTLAGEGLQHQDGNSHVLALPVPNLVAYDPAFAYEIAVIIQDG